MRTIDVQLLTSLASAYDFDHIRVLDVDDCDDTAELLQVICAKSPVEYLTLDTGLDYIPGMSPVWHVRR